MASTDPAVAIFQLNLGTAAAFDQRLFPLAYYKESGNISKGNVLIKATLEEMDEIWKLGTDLSESGDFVYDTRVKLQALEETKEKIEHDRKTRNPIKALLNYRAAWLFHAGSRALYRQTIRTSEKIHREEGRVRVVPSAQMRITNDAVSPDAPIGGILVDLPDGFNDAAKQTINNATTTLSTAGPFQDNSHISQLRDDEQAITLADTASLLSQDGGSGVDEGNQMSVASSDRSRPTSSQTINLYQFMHANLEGCTFSHGSRNSGASITKELVP